LTSRLVTPKNLLPTYTPAAISILFAAVQQPPPPPPDMIRHAHALYMWVPCAKVCVFARLCRCSRAWDSLSSGLHTKRRCLCSLSFLLFLTEGAVDRLWYGAAAEAAATNTSTKQRGPAVERGAPNYN
jgi:hypothetical protein